MTEDAIQFIADFYNVDREAAIDLYWNEIEAYLRLMTATDYVSDKGYEIGTESERIEFEKNRN